MSGTADDPVGKYGIASLTAAMLAAGFWRGAREPLDVWPRT